MSSDESEREPIMRYFCACSEWEHEPGMVVCWICEQPIADLQDTSDLNMTCIHNLLGLGVRYRNALEAISATGDMVAVEELTEQALMDPLRVKVRNA